MITTTNNWKRALGCQFIDGRDNLVPVNDVEIEYEQVDAVAQTTATVTSTGAESFSDTDEIMDVTRSYSSEHFIATLESNEWVLDGNSVPIDADVHCGWIGNTLCGSNGSFATASVLTLSWSVVNTMKIPGLTIQWSTLLDERPLNFSITSYKNNVASATSDFTATSTREFYAIDLEDYDKIEISISKWCVPNRRPRIEMIIMGMNVTISKTEIITAEQGLSSDLLTFTLPDDYFTFEIDNVKAEWNPDNPTGRYAYLAERQRINVRYAFKINGAYEWHKFGTYFMSEWTTPQNGITASFTARSLVDFMSKKFSPSSITGYSYGDTISLKALANAAFTQADLPIDTDGSKKWQIADDLNSINVIIPYTTSESEGTTTHSWNFEYSCAEVIQLCANAGCAVIRPNVDGDICIQMPVREIVDYYIDTFVSYTLGEYEIAKALKDVNINNGELIFTPTESVETGEEQAIANALLQSSTQRNSACAWISNLLLKRRSINGEFRADPRLEPLDVIKIDNKYASNQVYIDEVKWSYAGAFKGTYHGKVLKSIPLIDRLADVFCGDIDDNNVYNSYSGGY